MSDHILQIDKYPGAVCVYVDDGEGPCAQAPTEDEAVHDLLELVAGDPNYSEFIQQVKRDRGWT
jgi:hypothetical protein